jgi:hypothetical protein
MMEEMSRRKVPATPLEAMPEWMHGLKGFDELTFKRFDPASRPAGHGLIERPAPDQPERTYETWRVAIVMPKDIDTAAERTDPILFLPGLAGTIDELETRIGDIVRYCRAHGRSWTQIGEALSISKQAAWERFSGED